MPTLGGRMHCLCLQRHPQLLASRSKHFWSGANFVWSLLGLFVGAHPLCLSSWRHLPIDKCNGHWRNSQRLPPGFWKRSLWNNNRVPCCSWRPHTSVKVEWLLFCFQTIPQTPEQFSRKVSRNLIFAVWDESAKMVKIMSLENLALYGSFNCNLPNWKILLWCGLVPRPFRVGGVRKGRRRKGLVINLTSTRIHEISLLY